MVIIVHSSESDKTILSNIGAPDYSYYFVMKKFRPLLEEFARVVEVKKPDAEVDAIYETCRNRKEACLFLSFTPPHKTAVGLHCPTVCVFAWEYLTIPSDVWSDNPRNDWRHVFRQHGCAMTHSSFAVKTVKSAMGDDFPAWSIPAPLWDDYTRFYKRENISARSAGIDLSIAGTVVDFKGCALPFVPEDRKEEVIDEHTYPMSGKRGTRVHLQGIIYTSVFNPGDKRKNWTDLFKGFIWAFRNVRDVTLVLKVVHHDFAEARRALTDEIFKLTPFACRIVIIHGYLQDNDYATLVGATTYVVNTAHGEGQCLPLMEFMSAGKPAVAPDHTAMEDYIREDNAFVVRSGLERAQWPHDPRYALRTMRYRIDCESLYRAFLDSYQVAGHDAARYKAMSACAVDRLRQYCSKAVAKERLETVFRHYGFEKESAWLLARARLQDFVIETARSLRSWPARIGFALTTYADTFSPKRLVKQVVWKVLHILRMFLVKAGEWRQG